MKSALSNRMPRGYWSSVLTGGQGGLPTNSDKSLVEDCSSGMVSSSMSVDIMGCSSQRKP